MALHNPVTDFISHKVDTAVGDATAAALAQAPVLDAALDGKRVMAKVGPIVIPEFEVPVQFVIVEDKK